MKPPSTSIFRSPDLWPVFVLSCGLLGFEIGLMRILLYASWHHFAFLVISVVLLGFGASGTILTFLRHRLLPRREGTLHILILATAIAMPISVYLAQYVPVEAHVVPALLGKQVCLWILYWMLLTIPFILGASGIGLALMTAGRYLPIVYAANLAGSALGAIGATVAMSMAPSEWFGVLMGGVTLLGMAPLKPERRRRRFGLMAACLLGAVLWVRYIPPVIRVDPFKYQTYLDRLRADGRVTPLARVYGPRATIEAYEGEAFHELPFLSVGAAPPPMTAIVMDGHWATSVLQVANVGDAEVMDRTLMATPYALPDARRHVLLLGEAGGANIWLAARNQATDIHVVQPNQSLIELLRGPLRDYGGRVFDLPGVEIHPTEPRHFVEHSTSRFDLIQLVTMESWAAASGGMEGLNQDNLMTVEGMTACLRRLSTQGILFVCRGIQLPPRDNAKLLATFIASLRRIGVAHPEHHIAIVRDYLGICTMVRPRPWSQEEIDTLRRLCVQRSLTPVYFTGIRPDELNHPDMLPGPPGASGDWLYHVTTSLFSDKASDFFEAWPFDVRPSTDDRPFFTNFGKLSSIDTFRNLYGDLWMTQTELALLFVLTAMAIITVVGAMLTVLPLFLVQDIRQARGLNTTALYFIAIGLAYLMLEITMLSRLTHLLGDPIQAGAATIAGFLLFSGLGSMTAQRLETGSVGTVRRLILALVLTGILEAWLVGQITGLAGGWSPMWRFVAAILVISPMGFLMGFPMPTALARVERQMPALVPWAWGVNGFASVLASPLAIAIGMTWGFRAAGAAALGCYLAAAVLIGRVPMKG